MALRALRSVIAVAAAVVVIFGTGQAVAATGTGLITGVLTVGGSPSEDLDDGV